MFLGSSIIIICVWGWNIFPRAPVRRGVEHEAAPGIQIEDRYNHDTNLILIVIILIIILIILIMISIIISITIIMLVIIISVILT